MVAVVFTDVLCQALCKVGLMHDSPTSRDIIIIKIFNGVRNSDKLKNSAALSSGEFFSLLTGAAENFIFIVLQVLLVFFISCDIGESCISPTLAFASEMSQFGTCIKMLMRAWVGGCGLPLFGPFSLVAHSHHELLVE